MSNPTESFKINLNQNLWGLLISYITLGISEYYKLTTLYWFGLITSILCILSFTFTLIAYTINYWNEKINKNSNK